MNIRTENGKLKQLICADCEKAMRPTTVLYALRMLVEGFLSVYTATVLGKFADSVFELDFSWGKTYLLQLLLCVLATIIILPIWDTIAEMLMLRAALKHDCMVLGKFFNKTYEAARKFDEGDAQYRLENDPIDLRCHWVEIFGIYLWGIPFSSVYLLYHANKISPLFTAIVFFLSLLKLTVPLAVKKLLAKYDREKREYDTTVRTYETEITSHPQIVKLYGIKEALIKRLDEVYQNYFQKTYTKNTICTVLADNISNFLDIFCILLILLIGAVMVSKETITPGAAAAMVGYFSVMNQIITYAGELIKISSLLKNVLERMVLLYEEKENLSGRNVEQINEITAQNLSFCYGEMMVFDNLNFHLKPDTKTVIVGANGNGKSTLLKLLCGLLKDYKGSLKINQIELKDVAIESWRNQIAYAAQEPYLFEGTVRENIHLGNLNAEMNEVDNIMNLVGIADLAECNISNHQNNLSGGERQKISIARALMKDTAILILDEPSNNLDADTLQWLEHFIQTLHKTVLYISHKEELSKLAQQKIEL